MAQLQIHLIFLNILLCITAFKEKIAVKELGEKLYSTIKEKSNLPQHGICWYKALESIKGACDNLNDRQHSLLALQLANCFLEDSGHSTFSCHEKETESTRRECINNMSDRAFGVYNEFYTHTIHICFFLNYEMWQAETDNTIKLLHQVSSKMKEQLLEASEMQALMIKSQKEGLNIQNQLLDNGKELKTVITTSAETVNNMIVDFKDSAMYQKELLHEIFSYMRTFQSWIIGEVSWFQSIMYYTVSCILCALFSSSHRTVEARVTLFTILSLNIILERMLVQYHDSIIKDSTDNKIALVNNTWFLRKCTLFLCGITLIYTFYTYRDKYAESCQVLRRIEKKLNIIQTQDLTTNLKEPIRYSKRLLTKQLQVTSSCNKKS